MTNQTIYHAASLKTGTCTAPSYCLCTVQCTVHAPCSGAVASHSFTSFMYRVCHKPVSSLLRAPAALPLSAPSPAAWQLSIQLDFAWSAAWEHNPDAVGVAWLQACRIMTCALVALASPKFSWPAPDAAEAAALCWLRYQPCAKRNSVFCIQVCKLQIYS